MGGGRWETGASLGALILIWGTTFAAIRVGLEGIPPFTGLALRFALAGALLVTWGTLRGLRWPRDRRSWRLAGVNALGTFAVPYALTYWTEQTVPSGLVAILFATFPLFNAGLAHLALADEPLSRRGLAGTLLGLLGIALIFSEDLGSLGIGEVRRAALLFLLAPFTAAAANVTVRRWGREVSPLVLTGPPMLAAAALVGIAALAFEAGRPARWDAASIGSVVYLAVLGSAVAFVVYFRLLARMPATRLALITFAFPIVAVVVGALAFGERLTGRVALGAALVLAGVATTLGVGRRGGDAPRIDACDAAA